MIWMRNLIELLKSNHRIIYTHPPMSYIISACAIFSSSIGFIINLYKKLLQGLKNGALKKAFILILSL